MTTAPYSSFSFSTLLISLSFFNGSLLPAWVETSKEADWLPDVEANNEGFESNLFFRTDMISPLEISVNQVVFANLVRKMQNMSKASPFHWPNPYQTTTSPSYINILGFFFQLCTNCGGVEQFKPGRCSCCSYFRGFANHSAILSSHFFPPLVCVCVWICCRGAARCNFVVLDGRWRCVCVCAWPAWCRRPLKCTRVA